MINVKKYFPNIYEPELQAAIQEFGTINNFDEGTVIMDYGQYIQYLPMLINGTIKILREDNEGREMLLYYLEGGETCAMSLTCCLAQQKSEIKAIAESSVKMVNIPVKYMDEWMKKYDSWRAFVMQTYRNRFNNLLETIDSIAFMKMDERLLKYLHDKASHTNRHIFYTTHQAIAQEFNTSREVISRLLKQLEKHGKVELSRNKIKLIPPFET